MCLIAELTAVRVWSRVDRNEKKTPYQHVISRVMHVIVTEFVLVFRELEDVRLGGAYRQRIEQLLGAGVHCGREQARRESTSCRKSMDRKKINVNNAYINKKTPLLLAHHKHTNTEVREYHAPTQEA